MKLSKKQSFNKSTSHRRLWLSSIITLFILATSISAYFLVKNSQDIRKSASDPYQNDCICLYNSTCSAAGMKPCEGSCSPACSAPQICCQPITNDLCTQGERYCVDANRIATCKPDRSGYTISNCTNGTSCNSQQKLCIADPTPNPAATCQQNGGSCMSVSCASVYMQSIAGSCSNPSYNCCKTIQQFACDAGATECVNSTTRRYCNSERTAWITASCPSNSTCQNGTCVFPPTPTSSPQATCSTNGGSCMSVSCASVYMQSIAGSCSNPSYNCCKTIQQFACDAGEQECVNNTTRRYCNSERTAWITASCPSNSTCQNGTCVFPCQGTCYANSSCSVIGKYQAAGQCTNSSSVCCQEAPASCQGSCYAGSSCSALGKLAEAGNCPGTNTVCCKETSTPTCEGTCYTNTSCSAIGKVPASGTCRYDTSICCKEATTTTPTCQGTCYTNESCTAIGKVPASGTCLYDTSVCCKEASTVTSGLKDLGERCNDASECVSGNCSSVAWYDAYDPVYYLFDTCVPSRADQEVMVETSKQVGGTAALIAASFIPGVGPVIQIASAGVQGVQAYFTCSELAEVRADPRIDQATKDGYSKACATSVISSVTGLIGGAGGVVSTVAGQTMSAGTKVTLGVANMVDNVGNVVVSGVNVSTVCDAYGSDSFQCKAAIANAGVAVGSLGLGTYQFQADYKVYSTTTRSNSSASGIQSIGAGAYGETYLDTNKNQLIKVFKDPSDPNNAYQMNFYQQYSDQAPFITYRGTLPDGSGFSQDYFPNTVPAKNFKGKLTIDVINQAVIDLETMQNVTGVPHGDLAYPSGIHQGNTLIQTLPTGEHRVIIVDYAGTHDYYANLPASIGYDPNYHMQTEAKMFRQGLIDQFGPADPNTQRILNMIFGSGSTATTQGISIPTSSTFDWGFTVP